MVKKDKANYITKEWYEKLLAERKELKFVKLPEVLERLSEAKAMWDLSENFEYKSAMEDKDFIWSKLAEIDDLLEHAEFVQDNNEDSLDGIGYGSEVVLKIEWDKDDYVVKVVWIWEVGINSKDNLFISLDSPVWAAIRWHNAWDEVKMRLGNDRKTIKIIKVS